MRKTFVLIFDASGLPDWHVKAITRQMSDWIEANKAIDNHNLIIMPGTGDTKLYWLEGDTNNIDDVKTLEQVKDKLKPVLEIALDIKIDKEHRFKRPLDKFKKVISLAQARKTDGNRRT